MKLVCYFRVSTQRQGQSGLGLDGQREMVSRYASQHNAKVVGEYTEIESGKRCNRPEIAKAIAQCKRDGATLVVAKLDRLARSVSFTSALMDSGCEFVACDNPHATRLTIHILAAVAEHEALETSRRTKIALAARKAKGLPKITPPVHLTANARQANADKAAEYAASVLPLAIAKRKAGKTLQEIAHFLTGSGILTRRGKAWTPMAVKLLLAREAA